MTMNKDICSALLGLLTLCFVPPDAHSQGLQLDMGGASLRMEPESAKEEADLGRLVAGQLLGAARLIQRPELQKYVNLVGRRVADQSERRDLPWSFGVIDSTAVNAFAAPGGKILVTTALLGMLETEDELAAVLAHEVAHVVRKHHYRVIRKQKMLEFGAQAVVINDDAGMSAKLSGMVAQILARGLDQASEFEADRDGMVYAARAGYDASALIRVMEKLSSLTKKDEAADLLLSTHPSPESRRIAMARQVSSDLERAAVTSSASNRYRQYVR